MSPHIAPSPASVFSAPGTLPGHLPAEVAAGLLAAVGDVTFILDTAGTIIDVAVSQGDLANHGFSAWIGEPWASTMTVESRSKAAEMLRDVSSTVPPRWRKSSAPACSRWP